MGPKSKTTRSSGSKRSRVSAQTEANSTPEHGDGLACNECFRRKLTCDHAVPVCKSCKSGRRHCLYESYGRTPLTRKNLTSVEARLRQSEENLRLVEQRAKLAEARLVDESLIIHSGNSALDFHGVPSSNVDFTAQTPRSAQFSDTIQVVQAPFATPSSSRSDFQHPEFMSPSLPARQDQSSKRVAIGAVAGPARDAVRPQHLEVSPLQTDDFSWDEQSSSRKRKRSQEGDHDGMASLPSGKKRSGYLGTASGAAMMKLLVDEPDQQQPSKSDSSSPETDPEQWIYTPVFEERKIADIDMDAAINAYFSMYHISYPLVHEPTFRAQYTKVISRPHGKSWNALAYMVMAVGLFTSSTDPSVRDLDLFEAAKANISVSSLESGNVTLVQALALMSNYLQKRDKPNSGYNYLGLSLTMAMGIGMHREFDTWRTAPMLLEVRRRVWWTIFILYSGAMVTFGRPSSWPTYGVDIALPLNVDDRALTHGTKLLPAASTRLTVHSAVLAQAQFHLATNDIYARVISTDPPSVDEMITLDNDRIEPWRQQWECPFAEIPFNFQFSRNVMDWRYRNFRIIMYRPFLIKHVLRSRGNSAEPSPGASTKMAMERCLAEAAVSIQSISNFWTVQPHSRLAAWYSLYFIFQASLIPLIMLRNEPTSELAQGWRDQVLLVLQVIDSIKTIVPASIECHQVIMKLCGTFISVGADELSLTWNDSLTPVDELPSTQLENVYPMLWPNAGFSDQDLLGLDNMWATFDPMIDLS